jgi:hypothetical protein
MEKLKQYAKSPRRYFNAGHPEYETEIRTTLQQQFCTNYTNTMELSTS